MDKEEKNAVIDKVLDYLKNNESAITGYMIDREIGISEKTIRNWINGESRPNFANAKLIDLYLQNQQLASSPKDDSNELLSLYRETSKLKSDIIKLQQNEKSLTRKISELEEEIKRLNSLPQSETKIETKTNADIAQKL